VRPLYLKFSGINSYTGNTRIDFDLLQRDKIFGIFGETGAGKSTIIDAITFALFGRIDRVGNEVKTSINPLLKKIDVEFTFQVGSKIFKVNRTATEKKSNASLYRVLHDQLVPVADKSRDVNEEISKLIGGFDYQEFTKVIALPQNKFNEFLAAKPAERAMLLEKIFSLEKYGEELWQKVAEEEKAVFVEFQGLASALETLDDVSPESLKEKEHKKNKIEKDQAKEKKLLEKKEKELGELKELDKSLKDLKKIETDKRQLLLRESDIKLKREKLQNAEKAAPFSRDIENAAEWGKEIKKLTHDIEGLKERYASEKSALQSLMKEREISEEQKTKRLPEIAVSIKSAREAIELHRTIRNLKVEDKKSKEKLKLIKISIATSEKDLHALQKEKADFEKKRQAMRQRREALKLTEKEEVKNELLKAVEKEDGALREIERSVNKYKNEFKRVKDAIEDGKKEIDEKWKKTLPEIELLETDRAESLIISTRNSVQEKHAALIEMLHGEELRIKTSVIAMKLVEGEPCPVCGSPQHPAPAISSETDAVERIKMDIEHQHKLMDRIKYLEKEIVPFSIEMQRNLLQLTTAKENIIALEKKAIEIQADIVKKTGFSLKEGKLEKIALEGRIKEFNRLSRDLDLHQASLEQADQKIQNLQSGLSELRISETQVAEQAKQHETNIAETELKITSLAGAQEPEDLLKRLEKEQQEIALMSAMVVQNVEKKEKETKQIKEALAVSEGRKDETEKKLLIILERIRSEMERLAVSEKEFRSYIMSDKDIKSIRTVIDTYNESIKELEGRQKQIEQKLKQIKIIGYSDGASAEARKNVNEIKERIAKLSEDMGSLSAEIRRIFENIQRKEELLEKKQVKENELKTVQALKEVLRGKDFVHFIVKQLGINIIRLASESFFLLTSERMSLKLSGDKFNFFVEDHMTGEERPISTLSGGETFLASFSLALALSKHIQTMKARSIHFFFIDEGFGTLDDDTLTAVTGVMDNLKNEDVLVGFITHRKELRELVSSQILVTKSSTGSSSLRVIV
jgi:exonuclease SbcC